METGAPCRICDSAYTLYVQDVVGVRTGLSHPQRFCMDCRSFFHVSNYREEAVQKLSDFEFLHAERDNHAAIQSQLILELSTRLPGARSVLEIGHGCGYLLKGCRDYGLDAVGFEVNENCHRFAVEELGVTSYLGLFGPDHGQTYDLLIALQVFEHLEQPRELFATMRDHLNPDGAIYLSVPFVERHQWRFLWTADGRPTGLASDVFADNDVHITHFSIDGMKRMGLGLGARSADYFVSKDVFHKSPGSYQGVLFHF